MAEVGGATGFTCVWFLCVGDLTPLNGPSKNSMSYNELGLLTEVVVVGEEG